jgi:hypothetical protein
MATRPPQPAAKLPHPRLPCATSPRYPADMTQGSLVTFRNDRLGGRLTALANTMRLAQALEVPFHIHWHAAEDHGHVFNDPADFFAEPFLAAHLVDRDTLRTLRANTRLEQLSDLATIRARLAAGDNLLVDRALGLTLLPGEDAATVRDALAAIWRAFPFAHQLAPRMAAIRARVGAQATACHIRRGDILSVPRTMNKPWPNKFIIDEIFEAHIARATEAGDRPLLFSDDPATLRAFEARFPTLIAADTVVDPTGIGEGQRDLLELYAMSLCRSIVAPPQSAFSGTAATLGGGTLIDVSADLPAPALSAAWDTALTRLETAMPEAVARSPGRVGQTLAHLEPRLRATGDLPRARDLLGTALASGADISFLYPRHAALALETLPPAQALAIARAHAAAPPFHPGDLAHLRAQAAAAALTAGDPATSAAEAVTALAEAPAHRIVREVAGALFALGVLHSGTAPTLTPAAAVLHVARPRFVAPGTDLADLAARLPPHAVLPRLDAWTWDWDQIVHPVPRGAVARAAERPVWDKAFQRALRATPDDPDLLSLKALYDALILEETDAHHRLTALAAAHSDMAMVHHRRSITAFRLRHPKTTVEAAEAAVAAAPHAPAHLAWRAFVRARSKDHAGCRHDAETALSAGLTLPILHMIAARAAMAQGDAPDAGMHFDTAVRLAPRNPGTITARLRHRLATGAHQAAANDLALLESLAAPPVALPALRDAVSAAARHDV